ncbi:hypothetical protein BDD12DRAFT_234049 [Trichophaea hybrida]|nr:hypothetical protein BDD12DRAFT_234049 [Trichophaea hybrida]
MLKRGSNVLSSFSVTMNTMTEEPTSGGQEHQYESRHSDNMDVDGGGGHHLHRGDNGDALDSVSLSSASRPKGSQELQVYQQQQREPVKVDKNHYSQQGDQQQEPVQAESNYSVQQGGQQQQRETVQAGNDHCVQQGDQQQREHVQAERNHCIQGYQQQQRESVQAGRDLDVQQGTSQEAKQDHPPQKPSKESSKQISPSENEVSASSSTRNSSQGQSRSQPEPPTKKPDSNRENTGQGQIIYINGKMEVIKSSDGRLFTEEQLRYHEYYCTVGSSNPQ